MKNYKKGFAPIILLLIVVAAIGGGTYIVVNKNKSNQLDTNSKSAEAIIKADEMKNWKTYTDKKNRFEIKYPQDYFVSQQGSKIFISSKQDISDSTQTPNDLRISISTSNDGGKLGLEEWHKELVNDVISFYGKDRVKFSKENVTIANLPAIKALLDFQTDTENQQKYKYAQIFVISNDRLGYHFIYDPDTKLTRTLNAILSTFKPSPAIIDK